jgi:hypothetical protein
MKLAIFISWILAAVTHAAGLEFAELLKEFHAAPDAAKVVAEFNFTNHSNKPARLSNSDPGCSCLKVEVADGKLDYAPGESGMLRATFEMGNFSGTIDKNIALWVDDDPADKPSVKLTVRVHIPVLVNLEPKTLKWVIGGKPEPQTIHIQMASEKPIRVINVKSSSSAFTYEVKTIEEGKAYDLIVTPVATEVPGISVLRIETDCAFPKHRVQQAFALLQKP